MGILDDIELESYRYKDTNSKFAIVGISGVFPQAETVDEFFNKLIEGKDFVTKFPLNRSKEIKEFDRKINPNLETNYREAAYLDSISNFDYEFFNVSLSEAKLMDPRQRLLLTAAFRAFEDANMLNKIRNTDTGVFIGCSDLLNYNYFDLIKEQRPDLIDLSSSGNMPSMLSARISYFFDLKGPSVVLDTACSSSLIALDQAINSIMRGECQTALIASAHLMIYPKDTGYELGIESKDMRTRTFDDQASGTGVGEAVGAIVIKKLEDAIEDGDYIYSILDGVFSNQDGASIGITAPDKKSQIQLQTSLWSERELNIENTVYVEAHGTATKLGDDIEISALTDSFQMYSDKKQFCGIGSIKTNIGHTIDASGIVSLIKCIKIVEENIIPPSINFNYPNKNISFQESPFFIVDKPQKIKSDDYHVLLNSFGLSGTNVHVILKPYKNTNNKKKYKEIKKLKSEKIWFDSSGSSKTTSAEDQASILDIFKNKFGFTLATKETRLEDLNLDSIFITKIFSEINKNSLYKIEIADIYNAETIGDLETLVINQSEGKIIEPIVNYVENDSEYAIIGIDIKVGDCETKEEFFRALLDGRCFNGELTSKRYEKAKKFLELYKVLNPKFKKGNYLPDITKFDYQKFNIPKIEADLMDPNMRLMITSVYSAVCDAGYRLEDLQGKRWGTFIAYGQDFLFNYGSYIAHEDYSKVGIANIGNMDSMISGRIAYTFNLSGPAITINTSCSSGVVAINSALESLNNNKSDVAIVGGVKLNLCPVVSDENEIGIFSNTKSNAFAAGADGTFLGEGVTTIIIKKKNKAILDHDKIYATICGSSINHDGKTKGPTVPNSRAQSRVIGEAWENITVSNNSEIYIESHGTGTRLGDPIEISGINQSFHNIVDSAKIGLGAVKNNIGHLFEISGLVSVVKAALSLYYETFPKTIYFDYPNENIHFEESSVFINDINRKIYDKNTYIGISSFGFSGTNGHIVLKKYICKEEEKESISLLLEEKECWFENDNDNTLTITSSESKKSPLIRTKEIFSEVFGKNVEENESIYELGGDSLVAITIVSKINSEFSIELTISDILRNNTPILLSNKIENIIGDNEKAENRILSLTKEDKYIATPQQLRMYKMSQTNLETGLNVNIRLKIRGLLDVEKFERIINHFIKNTEIMRVNFQYENRTLYQKIKEYKYEKIKVEKIEYTELVKETEKFIGVFNLESDSLYRYKLLKINQNEYYFLFDVHHIIFDFQSMKMFLKHLIVNYNNEKLIRVDNKDIDYQDFAKWYNSNLKLEKKKENQLKLWKQEFKNFNFSSDQKFVTNSVEMVNFRIDQKISEKLHKYSLSHDVSVFSVLLASYFMTAKSMNSSLSEEVVGIPISGRHYEGTNNIIGLFRNALPVKLNYEHHTEPLYIIKQVYQKILFALENQDVQTHEIEESLNISENLFKNYFIFQDTVDSSEYELDELKIETELIRRQALFDIKWELVKINNEYHGIIEYRDELFTPKYINDCQDEYLRILSYIVSN